MQHYTSSVTDQAGNALTSATVNVYAAGTTTLSTIYSDNGITPAANPLTSASDGSFHFYAANGRYDLVITKAGFTFVPAETAGIALYDAALPTGNWTPNVGGTATYSAQTGVYVKSGPLVFIYGFISILSIGTGSTGTILGLPYLPTQSFPIALTRSANLALSVVSLSAYVNPGALQVNLIGRTVGSVSETDAIAVLGNAASITFAGMYLTNS